jgi:hypothetical protein
MPRIASTGAKARIIAIAALPLLLLIGGSVYLVRLAAGGSQPDAFVPAPSASAAPGASSGAATDTAGPAPTGGNRRPPPAPRVSVTVGGVRLDGTVPRSDSCMTFLNTEFPVPVRVVGVQVANGPDFMVADDAPCKEPDLLQHPFRPCPDATLSPGGPGCDAGVGVSRDGPPLSNGPDSVQHHGTLQLRLRVRCTSKAAQPCASLPDRYSPSPAAPIEVTWTDEGRDRTVSVAATPEPPPTSDAPSPDGSIESSAPAVS